MQAFLDRRTATPEHYGMMRYHLGWADERLSPTNAPAGKRLRPLICLLAAEACDAQPERALPAAVEPAWLLKEQLRRAIATLDTDDATLFLLRYVEGLSNQELAEEFQLEKNNVAVRLHRIRLRLQAEMER